MCTPGQEGVDLRDDRGPLADGRPHPLYRAATDVADGEDALDAGSAPSKRTGLRSAPLTFSIQRRAKLGQEMASCQRLRKEEAWRVERSPLGE